MVEQPAKPVDCLEARAAKRERRRVRKEATRNRVRQLQKELLRGSLSEAEMYELFGN